MRTIADRSLLMCVALLSGATAAFAPRLVHSANVEDAKLAAVKQVIAEPKGAAAPGCAVGAFRDGQTLFLLASGGADTSGKRPLDESTLFYAASMSKQFTVLALAKLVEQGKAAMDDDVRKWIPELPVFQAPVTVQMLVHHTSGIRDWLDLAYEQGVRDAGTIARPAALDMVLKQTTTEFVPGTQFKYSNGGYLLLSEIVARASAMPFHEFARKHVFAPMGMSSSFFLDGSRPTGEDMSHGYVPKENGFEVRDTYPLTGGSGGLVTSIADLARYDRDVQVNHSVWTTAVANIMLTPGKLSDGTTIQRGTGFDVMSYAGGLMTGLRAGRFIFQHSGAAEGFRGNYIALPDRHLSVALLCNRGDLNPEEKTDRIIDILEGTSFALERERKQAEKNSPAGKAR